MLREAGPEPFFFGADGARLFGIHHEPFARGRNAQTGIVICYPIGQEYVRSHAALAALANRLARAGFHVLRFDYTGSGDSEGEECELAACKRDIAAAVDELRQGTGVTRVWLFGLRLGATLAAEAAQAGGVDGVAMWEPVIRGEPHIAELRASQRDWAKSQGESMGRSNEGGEEFLGFWFTRTMCREILAIDMLASARSPAPSLLLLGEPDAHAPAVDALERTWSTLRPRPAVSRMAIASGGFWRKIEDAGGPLIPTHALDQIVECLCQAN